MTATAISPELAARAREYMIRAEHPMPVPVAFDWLREQVDGTEDLAALKKGLYGAAADWLRHFRPGTEEHRENSPTSVCIANGLFGDAANHANTQRAAYSHVNAPTDDEPKAWLVWCDRADALLTICREIAALGGTE